MKTKVALALLLAVAPLTAGEPSLEKPSVPAVAPVRAAPTADRYNVILRKNIFAKDRQNLNADGSTPPVVKTTVKEPPKPEALTVLVGVVERDGKLSAMLENRGTGKTQVLHSGDSVAGGKIGTITLDSIEYSAANAGSAVTVSIGRTLEGGAPPMATDAKTGESTATTSSASGGTAAPAVPAAPSGSNDILERMRKKRQEELSK